MVKRELLKLLDYPDMVGLLRYMGDKLAHGDFVKRITKDTIRFETILFFENWDYAPKQYQIPNKPFHLYTEKEEQTLFELIERLK